MNDRIVQRMISSYLAEPHIHEGVPGLTDFPHVQLSCPWCHQTRGHASWVWCVQTSQLVERSENFCYGMVKRLVKPRPRSYDTFLATVNDTCENSEC